jgi:hypothetical protein
MCKPVHFAYLTPGELVCWHFAALLAGEPRSLTPTGSPLSLRGSPPKPDRHLQLLYIRSPDKRKSSKKKIDRPHRNTQPSRTVPP